MKTETQLEPFLSDVLGSDCQVERSNLTNPRHDCFERVIAEHSAESKLVKRQQGYRMAPIAD